MMHTIAIPAGNQWVYPRPVALTPLGPEPSPGQGPWAFRYLMYDGPAPHHSLSVDKLLSLDLGGTSAWAETTPNVDLRILIAGLGARGARRPLNST